MKKILLLVLLLIPSISFADITILTIKGMVCSFCSQGIEKLLMEEEGVLKVLVDLDKATVTITTKDGVRLDSHRLYKLIRDAGFELETIELK
jgi:mercuric ion binding protein